MALVLLLPLVFAFTGCDAKEVVSIKDISRTGGEGIVDIYTITYTNGDTDQFTVVNGEDGLNLYNNITIRDLYNEIKDTKPAGYSLIDFIDEYLDIKIDADALASSTALRSAVSIFVEHQIEITDYEKLIYNPGGLFEQGYYEYGHKNSIAWGAGAGVIYNIDKQTGDAYIITNYHVCFSPDANSKDGIATKFTTYIYGAETISTNDLYCLRYYNENCKEYKQLFEYDDNGLPIIDYGYGAIEAEYVGGSETYDIAVLKISNSEILKNSDCIAVESYDSDFVTAGSSAIAVGNPDACGISVTNGVVSVDSEYIAVKISDSAVVLREFRIDTPVNPGNSGGGLFDGHGRLIGIVNAKTTDTTIENMSYAIPSNIATWVADSIIDNCDGVICKTKKVVLGVVVEAINSKASYDQSTGLMRINETVAIVDFETNSIAQSAGLKTGDIITGVKIVRGDQTINDTTVNRVFKAIDPMIMVREGDVIIINYTRAGVDASATIVTTGNNFTQID